MRIKIWQLKMKTGLLIIIGLIFSGGFVIIIPQGFASCIVNDDWYEAPCLDTIGNGWYNQEEVDQWSNYYLYKGPIFMEAKFLELNDAITQERLEDWTSESIQNRNVYEYYFFSGRAPNTGEYHGMFDIITVYDKTPSIFFGTTIFDGIPTSIIPEKLETFEIKFQYTEGPYHLNLVPIFDVTPQDARPFVSFATESTEVARNSIARIPVTITVDSEIPHEKIFLSVTYAGLSFDTPYKSGWNDSITFDIAPKDQVGTLVDYEIIPWDELGYEINNRATIFTKNTVPRSTLEAGQQYFIIQKVDFSNDNFAENSTFSAVVGYAIQKGNQMIPFPKGEHVTDAEHQEFAEKTRKQRIEFSQESEIAKSFEFVIDPENPFYVKSSLVIEEPGKYTRQYYKKLKFSPSIMGSNMGGLVVLDKFSKAIDENGRCKNDGFGYLIKHDYSTAVCVEPETVWKLKGRGWAI